MIQLGVHLPKKTTDATRVTILLIVLESIAWSVEQWTQQHNGFTTYVCAFGYCMMKGKSDFEDILRESDKVMYADKVSIKKAVLEAGGKLHRRTGD